MSSTIQMLLLWKQELQNLFVKSCKAYDDQPKAFKCL